jgi:hypothetical protein
MKHVPSERWYLPTSELGVKTHETNIELKCKFLSNLGIFARSEYST